MAVSTPDPDIVKYAPNTAALGQALAAGQGSDYITVLTALGKVEIVTQLLLDVLLLKILGPQVDPTRAAVIAKLNSWLKEIDTTMKTGR